MNYKDWFGMPQGSATKPITAADKLNYGAGVGMGAISLLGTVAGNLAGNKEELSKLQAQNVTTSTKSDLASQIANYSPLQLGRENLLASGLSGLATGAGAGMTAGPIGAAIGGAVGLASSLIGSSGRNRQKKLTEGRLYESQMNKFNSANAMLTEQGITNALTNYAAYGGQFNIPSTYNTGLVEINNGGTHDQNPLGGVPYGIGANGKNNFVEEGEVIHNEHVFSNRLKVLPTLTKPLGLPSKLGDKSFAKAAKLISKESKERPYDPISRLTKDALLGRLGQLQDISRQAALADKFQQPLQSGNYFALGTTDNNNGFMDIMSRNFSEISQIMKESFRGATRSVQGAYRELQKQFPILFDPQTLQPLSPQRTAIAPQTVPPSVVSSMVNNPFLLTPQQVVSRTIAQPTPPRGNQVRQQAAQQPTPQPQNTKNAILPKIAHNLKLPTTIPYDKITPDRDAILAELRPYSQLPLRSRTTPQYDELGMFAPAVSNLATLLNYAGSPAETVNIPRISAGTRLNEIAPYTPIDTNYLTSQIKGQAAGTRRSILDLAAGNRGAATSGLISADQNYLGALADSYLKASEYNRAQQMQNLQFTNQARQANAALNMQEQAYNQQASLQEQQLNAANRAARRTGILQGIQAIGSNLGEVSRYNKNLRAIRNAYMYTDVGEFLS